MEALRARVAADTFVLIEYIPGETDPELVEMNLAKDLALIGWTASP